MTKLQQLFDEYLSSQPVFLDPTALTLSFTPSTIPHREKQIEAIGKVLAPSLKGMKPSNIFIYGKCGTGKSLVVKYVTTELEKIGKNVKVIWINCKMKGTADTQYRALAAIAKELGKEIPFTGLPTNTVYKQVFDAVDQKAHVVLLVMDEIDALVNKTGDEILYNLTRVNQELSKAKLSIIGITNELNFLSKLEPRVRSSLSEEEFIFPPYNAVQLQDILRCRSQLGFRPNVIGSGVIEKAAALAAQEHGDARRALDFLRVAGELAERSGDKIINVEHIDAAQGKIDTDRVLETLKTQPKQSQAVLAAIAELSEKSPLVQTGDVFGAYYDVCQEHRLKPLTNRRVSDLIAELDMFGIIQTRIISKGRYGRTRMINLAMDNTLKKKIKSLLLQ